MKMKLVWVRLLWVLVIVIGIVLLQIFLSKRENKWAGRILPFLFFLCSLIVPLNMAAVGEKNVAFWIDLLLIWFVAASPAMILWGIYLSCRNDRKKQQEMDKMNIQDLN